MRAVAGRAAVGTREGGERLGHLLAMAVVLDDDR